MENGVRHHVVVVESALRERAWGAILILGDIHVTGHYPDNWSSFFSAPLGEKLMVIMSRLGACAWRGSLIPRSQIPNNTSSG